MLPLFDMVFASDKATFHTPYAQLGQVPEGGATLTLPHLLGHTAVSRTSKYRPCLTLLFQAKYYIFNYFFSNRQVNCF